MVNDYGSFEGIAALLAELPLAVIGRYLQRPTLDTLHLPDEKLFKKPGSLVGRPCQGSPSV